jgi:hypothetical protein
MMQESHSNGIPEQEHPKSDEPCSPESKVESIAEIGGRGGLDPTRYGDWEKNGRCIDF